MKRPIKLNLSSEELGRRLVAYRAKHNRTQWEMVIHEFRNEISLRTYCSWENGGHRPWGQAYLLRLKRIGII